MPKLKLNGARVVILALVALFFAVMIAGPGTMLALAVAPGSANLIGKVVCPTGTNMRARWVRYSYSRPGQSNFEISCGPEGGPVSNESTWWFPKLFVVYFGLLLLPAFYLSLAREKPAATPNPSRP
jgi:hypothetical protein